LPVASGAPQAPPQADAAPQPRTEAQKAAARENGKKSRGPVTEEGKERSRRNALKHGYRAQSLATAPPDFAAEASAETVLFYRDRKPQNHVEQRLVEIAALSAVRFLRLETAERACAQQRVRHARRRWTEARRDEVLDLISRLKRNDSPAPARRALRATAHGCRALARLLEKEARRLALAGTQLDRCGPLNACGLPGTPSHPDDLRGRRLEFWRSVYTLEGTTKRPSLFDANLWALVTAEPIAPDSAREYVIAFLNDKAARLRERAEKIWQERDEADWREAPVRAVADAGPEGKLLARYMNDAKRTLESALKALKELRKADKRERQAPNEPTTTQPIWSQRVSETPATEPAARPATPPLATIAQPPAHPPATAPPS
jgi:hypothetical protein